MAIYEFNNNTINAELEKYRTKEELGTSISFSSDIELNKMIQHISGMPWILESYFTQIGDINDLTESVSLEVGGHQSYERIMKLKVYLQSPLDQTNPDDLTGSFIVNAGFYPRLKDMFVAELTGGRLGLFTIEEVENNTYNNNQCYTCNFKLFVFLEDENIDYYNNLIKKTVGPGKVYNEDYLFNQNTPLLSTGQYNIRQDLINAKKDLTSYFLKHFINDKYKLILYPTTQDIYYDPYLTEFLFKTISLTEYPELSKVNRVDYKDDEIRNTVFDMLLNRNPQMLYRVDKHLNWSKVPTTKANFNSRNIYYLGINYIIKKIKDNEAVIKDPTPVETDLKYKPNLSASLTTHHTEFLEKTIDNIKKANDSEFFLQVPKLEFDGDKEDMQEKEDTVIVDEEILPDTPDISEDIPNIDMELEVPDSGTNVLDQNSKDEINDLDNIEFTITKEDSEIIENVDITDEELEVAVNESETLLESTNDINMINYTTEELNPVEIEDYSVPEDVVETTSGPRNITTSIKATKQYSLFKKK